MASSGTVGSTVLDTALVIDHAVRRCGLPTATLTPEQLDTARNNLFLILSSLANRGINLWCIDKQILPMCLNQAKYLLPVGTLDILNVNYRTVTPLLPTVASAAASWTGSFTSATPVITVGILFGNTAAYNLVFEYSTDNVTWSTALAVGATNEVAGAYKWYDIDPAFSALYFRIRETVSGSVNFANVILSSQNYEIPVDSMSRDTYNDQVNKQMALRPLSYYFEKTIVPSLTVWPLATDPTSQLVYRRQRQIQDVGSLMQSIEVPDRWKEAIIWRLSKNLCFELPGVDPARIPLVTGEMNASLTEAEAGETDGSPFFLQPNIRGYTR